MRLFLMIALGACMGSFLLCVHDRRASGLDWTRGRSKCDACGHELGVLDLVPIVSYVVFRGRCRYCKARLDRRYLVAEAIGALGGWLVVVLAGMA